MSDTEVLNKKMGENTKISQEKSQKFFFLVEDEVTFYDDTNGDDTKSKYVSLVIAVTLSEQDPIIHAVFCRDYGKKFGSKRGKKYEQQEIDENKRLEKIHVAKCRKANFGYFNALKEIIEERLGEENTEFVAFIKDNNFDHQFSELGAQGLEEQVKAFEKYDYSDPYHDIFNNTKHLISKRQEFQWREENQTLTFIELLESIKTEFSTDYKLLIDKKWKNVMVGQHAKEMRKLFLREFLREEHSEEEQPSREKQCGFFNHLLTHYNQEQNSSSFKLLKYFKALEETYLLMDQLMSAESYEKFDGIIKTLAEYKWTDANVDKCRSNLMNDIQLFLQVFGRNKNLKFKPKVMSTLIIEAIHSIFKKDNEKIENRKTKEATKEQVSTFLEIAFKGEIDVKKADGDYAEVTFKFDILPEQLKEIAEESLKAFIETKPNDRQSCESYNKFVEVKKYCEMCSYCCMEMKMKTLRI